MEDDIRLTRTHRIHDARKTQLRRNFAVFHGGRDYVKMALTRFPHEDDVSWSGDSALGVKGRCDRAYLINYAQRIVNKMNQYVFSEDAERDGIDKDFSADVTASGLPVEDFMLDVSSALTTAGWLWLHVDRGAPAADPETGEVLPRSILDRERSGDRVYWSIWRPDEVVDWHFDHGGNLVWLMTQTEEYDNENPTLEPSTRTVRTLWELGKMTRLVIGEDGKIERQKTRPVSLGRLPWIPVGIPTDLPWWFDDVERVQAALLNLESAHDENLIQAVYPQLVMPQDAIENTMMLCDLDGPEGYEKAVQIVRGLNYPIQEPADAKGITRYLMPSGSDLKAIPDEILRRRKELYQIVGMAMNNAESRQVQSAEAKAWDNLDPSATVAERAKILEGAERKLVQMSKEIDSTFTVYDPRYPRQFDIPDVATDMAALIELDNIDMPEEARREVRKAAMRILGQVVSIPKDRMKAVMDKIDTWKPDDDLPGIG